MYFSGKKHPGVKTYWKTMVDKLHYLMNHGMTYKKSLFINIAPATAEVANNNNNDSSNNKQQTAKTSTISDLL